MKNKYRNQIKSLNAARNQYNPLRGITLQQVVSLLEAGERGEYNRLQWLYRTLEKRDAVVRALKHRRSSALQKLEWQIKTIPADQLPNGFSEKQAKAQAQTLRGLYEGIENLYDAIKSLSLAEFRGFAHLEKVYRYNRPAPDAITRLELIEQWYWTRDGILGDWMFDPNMRGSSIGAESIDLKHIIIREVEDPINEIAIIAFLRKSMSQKDWDSFVEVFGIPDLFFEMPAGLDEKTMKAWMDSAERLAGDGTGAIPNGGKVVAVGGDVRGVNPFEDHLKYQDTLVVLAGTGGKLSMLTDPTGLGSGASDAHEDAFDDLAAEEARTISELFQRNLDLPLLQSKFPNQPVLAYFDLCAIDIEDTTELVTQVKTLFEAGYQVDIDELQERTGFKLGIRQEAQGISEMPLQNRNLRKSDESVDKEKGVPLRPSRLGGSNLFNLKPKIDNSLMPLASCLKIPLPLGGSNLFNRKSKISNRQSFDSLLKTSRKLIASAVQADLMPIAERIEEILDETPDDQLIDTLRSFVENDFLALAEICLQDPKSAQAFYDSFSASIINGLTSGK